MNKKVLLFLAQGFEEYEASVFTDVIGWSRVFGKEPVDLVTTGLRPEIKCTWNFIVRPELEFEKVNVRDFDALAIPGGFENAGFYEDAYDENFLNLIREFDKEGKIIAAICVAAMPLGKSGILKERKATTYDLLEGVRRKQLSDFGANVQDKKIVIDNNIITSTGPSTALDVAFNLLEMLTDKENVGVVKKYMRFTDPLTKKLITSNSPLEPQIGFSRAVKMGNVIVVSGTAPIENDGSTAFKGDLYNQTKFCIEIIKHAVEQAGGRLENIIRTRIMLKDISIWEEAAKAHGEYFSEIRPACTFVEISRFINEEWLVEIESDCIMD